MLKKIRESRNKTKYDVYNNIMSASSYSAAEEDINNIKIGDLIQIVKRLDIRLDEFYYFSTHGEEFTIIQDIRNLNNFVSKDSIISLIEKYKDDSIYFHTLKCILFISQDDLESAKIHANEVWLKLANYDELFASELFCLSHIFLLFEGENFYEICKRIQESFSKWRNFGDFYKVEIIFLLNLGRITEDIDLKKSLNLYEEAYQLSIKYNLGSYTGILLYSIGRLKNSDELKEQGKLLLKIFDHKILDNISIYE